jgi:hypothetical protein
MRTLQIIRNIVEGGNMSRLTRQQFLELSEESKYQQYVNEEYRADTYKRIAISLSSGGENLIEDLEDLLHNDSIDKQR